MAEDREDASPSDKEEEQFEVLDEVGEVEGWDDNLLPDDEENEEGEMEVDKPLVDPSSLDDKKPAETENVDRSPICVKPVSMKSESPAIFDKENKDQLGKSLNNQTPMVKVKESLVGQNENSDSKREKPISVGKDKNSESLTFEVEKHLTDSPPNKDGKLLKESAVNKVVKLNESVASKDGKSSESVVSRDGNSLNESAASKVEKPSNESAAINDGKPANESAASKEESSSESVASKEGKPLSKPAVSKQGKPSSESAAKKEGMSSSDAVSSKDRKLNETTSSKAGKSNETDSSKDKKTNETASSKDRKTNETISSKDGKSNETASSKDGKSNETVSSKDRKSNETTSSKAGKSNETNSSKDKKTNETASSKDRKTNETISSKDGKSNETNSSKDKKTNETASSKDRKTNETISSKDGKSNETASSKDRQSNETTSSKAGKSNETNSSKDKKTNETASSKDRKTNETISSKDGKSNETASSKDGKSNETVSSKTGKSSETASSKTGKSSQTISNKDTKSSSDTVSSKDGKLSNETVARKNGKSVNESAISKGGKLSDSPHTGKDGKLFSNQSSAIKGMEDKKRTDAKNNESRKQTAGSVLKRKSDEPAAQKSDEKKIKLHSKNTDQQNVKSSDQEIDGIFTLDPLEEHAIKKDQFIKMMDNLSEELKTNRDFRRWAEKHRKDGMMFPLCELKQPCEMVLFSRCQLISGYEPNSNKLCLGIRRNKSVRRFWACEKKFVATVRKVVKAFEEMVKSSGKPLFDPNTQQGFWHSMGVHANSRDQAILQVHLHATNKEEGEARFTQAKNILLSTFKPKKGQHTCVSSIYLRLVLNNRSNSAERMANCCIMGLGFINEVLKGVTIKLYPWTYFSTGTSAMSALCEELMSILMREGCHTVLEIGCRTGVIGQLLSKFCKMVLGIDTSTFITDAKQNAEDNKLTNCKYFDGNFKDALVAFNKEIQNSSSIMVIVNAMCYDMAEDPEVLVWLQCTEKVHRVVYIKPVKPDDKTSVVAHLCTSGKEVRHSQHDRMPYLPLYALPIDLGTKTYTAVIVLKHVENNFINELYQLRNNSVIQYNNVGNLETTKLMVVGDRKQGQKSYGKSSYTNKNLLAPKSNDPNTKFKTSAKISQNRDRSRSPIIRSKMPSKGNNQGRSRSYVKSGARNRSRSDSSGPMRRNSNVSKHNHPKKHEGDDHTNRSGPHLHGDHGKPRKTDNTSGSRNVWLNEDGLLTTCVDASRQGVTTLQTQDLRNVLQSRPGYRHPDSLLDSNRLISHEEVKDLRTVLEGKRMYAERPPEVVVDKPDRFKQNVIHDVRKRKMADSSFAHDIFPPGTEDLRHVLQEKKVMVVEKIAGDRNMQGRDFHDISLVDSGRSHFRVKENHDLRSFIEENRASHRIVEKDSFRESARLPNNAEAWDCSHTRVNSPSSNMYPSNMWGHQQGPRDTTLEAFPLAKDSALFDLEIGNKTNTRGNDRKVIFSVRDTRNVNFGLHGTGRSFDDAELGRRTSSRADDIASGTRTDVRGLSKSWKFRDIRDMESIHDSFNRFDQHRNVMPEFGNASANSNRRALSPGPKLHIANDKLREIPYYSNDKSNFYSGADKSSKMKWFPLDDKNISMVGATERSKINLEVDRSRLMFSESDRRRTIVDGNERNRTIGESMTDRRHFGGTERAATDGPDRDTNVFDGTINRNRTVFGEVDNRNKSVFGEPEGRNRSVFSGQDRNRSGLSGPEDRSRSGLSGPGDRVRSGLSGPENRGRSGLSGPEDRGRSGLSGPENRGRSGLSGPEDRGRSGLSGFENKGRSGLSGPEDRGRSGLSGPEDRGRSGLSGPGDRGRSGLSGPEDRGRSGLSGFENKGRSSLSGREDRGRPGLSGLEDRGRPGLSGPEDRGRSGLSGFENKGISGLSGFENKGRSSLSGREDRGRPGLSGPEDRGRSGLSGFENKGISGLSGFENKGRSGLSGSEERGRSGLSGPLDRGRSGLSGPDDRNQSFFGRPEDRIRSVFVGPEERNRSVLSGGESNRLTLSGPEDRNRSTFGGPGERNSSMFGGPENRNKQIYGESEGRNRSMFGGAEDSFAFDGVDNKNRSSLGLDDRTKSVGVPERNRVQIEEVDRNRMFGGSTELNRKGYNSTDSKNVISGYGGRGYEEKQIFVAKDPLKSDLHNFKDPVESKIAHRRENVSISKNPQHDKSKPLPPTLDGHSKENSTYYRDGKHNLIDTKRPGQDSREKFKEHGRPEKVFGIPVLQREYNSRGQNSRKFVQQAEPKYQSSSSYDSRASEKKYSQESVQNRDAKNIYGGDRTSEKISFPFWTTDTNVSDASRKPSNTNREWDRTVQSGSHHGPAMPWVDTRRGEDKQGHRDNAGKTYRMPHPDEEKQWSQLPAQHLGKYGLQEERQGNVKTPDLQTFRSGNFPRQDPQSARGVGDPVTGSNLAATVGAVPQAYEHVLQQLLSSGNIPAALSAMLPGVNLGNAQSFISSSRNNSGGRSGQSGGRVFPWMH